MKEQQNDSLISAIATHCKLSIGKRLPLLVKVIIAIILGILFGTFIPDVVVRAFNTFNGLFDQLLRFLIPLIIVGLVTSAIADIGKGAGRMLFITGITAYCATVLSGLFSYGCSASLFPAMLEDISTSTLSVQGRELPAFFSIEIEPVMGVMTSLVLAFMIGLGIASFGAKVLKEGFDELKDIVSATIERVIIPLLPIYIFGLFLNIAASGKVAYVLLSFLQIIAIIFVMSIVLLIIQYCVAGIVCRRNPLVLLKNMLPAYFTALGTSSSAATIPVTLKQSIKNGVCEEVAGFTVPLCATIHLSGSTLKIVACALAIMIINQMPFTFTSIFGFILMLGVTMVAAPGVPGGAIMAALGILESILGFTSEQQAMMITLYIAMDSFGTACNVTGDGAIALIIDRLRRK